MGEISVLDRQLGEPGNGRGVEQGLVVHQELARQHLQRPAVRGDGVDHDDEEVLFSAQPQQGEAQRPPRRIERPPRDRPRVALRGGLAVRGRQGLEIPARQGPRFIR